jgi:phasin family protein
LTPLLCGLSSAVTAEPPAELHEEDEMAKQPQQESILDMFSRLGSEMKLPKMDVEAVLSHHRKNLEALEKSARTAASGANSVMARQREALEETFGEFAEMARSYGGQGNPQDLMSKQAEFARKSFEEAVKNAGDVAEIVRKSGSEAIDILRQRMEEAMKEVRSGVENRK